MHEHRPGCVHQGKTCLQVKVKFPRCFVNILKWELSMHVKGVVLVIDNLLCKVFIPTPTARVSVLELPPGYDPIYRQTSPPQTSAFIGWQPEFARAARGRTPGAPLGAYHNYAQVLLPGSRHLGTFGDVDNVAGLVTTHLEEISLTMATHAVPTSRRVTLSDVTSPMKHWGWIWKKQRARECVGKWLRPGVDVIVGRTW